MVSSKPSARLALRYRLTKHGFLLLASHLALLTAAYAAAYQLRFDFSVPVDMLALFWATLPWLLVIKVAIFHWFGSFQVWWRSVMFADLATLLKASLLSTLSIASLDYFFIPHYQVPRAVVLLDCCGTILLVGGVRCTWRMFREHVWPAFAVDTRRPAFLIGVDRGGAALARQIHSNRRLNYRIVGFVDEDPSRQGSRLGGIPFLASPNDAVRTAKEYQVSDILTVAHSISGNSLRNVVEQCRHAGIRVRMIPSVDELINGTYTLQIRDVNISDLLRRESVQLDGCRIGEMLSGRRVLVTGAGGSIGSEICRQILPHNPERLILVERAENALFSVQQELQCIPAGVPLSPCVADIGDRKRMSFLLRKYRPQIIFHAAAHKHVPLMEDNAGEAIKNNVIGTRKLADLADEHAVERFVLISTDKAVHPASIMGLTKQIAERYVHAMSEISATRFIVVRFGNVLGSAGSVVPIFQEQIRRGGPITITDPEMLRFFMTIPEASQLVLEAAALGGGGEVFVLDMGEPVRIIDLAHDLIRLSGLSLDEIGVRIIGPRPGEKLREEIYHEEERTLPTPHPKVRIANHRDGSLATVRSLIGELARLADESEDVIRQALRRLVPEYVPPAELREKHTPASGNGHGSNSIVWGEKCTSEAHEALQRSAK